MNKQEVYDFLKNNGIEFEAVEHPAVFHMGEDHGVELPHPEADAKNLFVRDDKKQNYCLITVRGGKKVDLKAFRREHGLRPLSFGSPEALKEKLDLIPGSVCPFGLLNRAGCDVKFYLDADFLKEPYLIGCHPNDNTATVFIKTDDMIRLLESHNISVEVVELPLREE
ncbi:MAG: prolyl-tRNA synthetase associated domain-containing protein [Clostridiales bacterium]|nr:prolyl-tRNA synthetase associated domain-containing protein [Clostridiales bacterium]